MANTTPRLPDFRRHAQPVSHPLLALAAAADTAGLLVEAVREHLARRDDAEIMRALGLAPDRELYTRLWQALCVAAERPGGAAETVATAVFAFPLVIVSGARRETVLPGTLRDVSALAAILEQAKALGGSRSFGFSNALCSLPTLEQLAPSTVREWQTGAHTDAAPRALAPEAIAVRPGEEVHLRFLPGAAVSPATAPSVIETAAHIARWGMPLARALTNQLAAQGVDLLVLPRPPAGLVSAVWRGRRAQLETALNLFLSNTIRRTRARAGEPSLVLSVHATGRPDGELRVSVSAALDDTLLEGFRWPLHPLDDPNEIAADVLQFAADCSVPDVRVVDTLLPPGGMGSGLLPGGMGSGLFVRARELSRAGS